MNLQETLRAQAEAGWWLKGVGRRHTRWQTLPAYKHTHRLTALPRETKVSPKQLVTLTQTCPAKIIHDVTVKNQPGLKMFKRPSSSRTHAQEAKSKVFGRAYRFFRQVYFHYTEQLRIQLAAPPPPFRQNEPGFHPQSGHHHPSRPAPDPGD